MIKYKFIKENYFSDNENGDLQVYDFYRAPGYGESFFDEHSLYIYALKNENILQDDEVLNIMSIFDLEKLCLDNHIYIEIIENTTGEYYV